MAVYGGPNREWPGEFSRLRAIDRSFDGRLVTFDSGHRRVSVFEVDGEVVRTVQLAAGLQQGVGTMAIGWLESGTFVARILESAGEGGTAEVGQWRVMDSMAALLFFDEAGSTFGTPMRTLGDQRLSMMTAQEGSEYTFMALPNPFLRSFVGDARGSRVAFGQTFADEIHILNANGDLVRIVRRDRPERNLTGDMIEEWIDSRVSGISDQAARRRRRQQYENMPFPPMLPAFRSVLLDEDGRRLWVEEFELDAITSDGEGRWSVYAEDGRPLGEVGMPPGFRPLRIGVDYMLGLWRDDLGVEHVQLRELKTR